MGKHHFRSCVRGTFCFVKINSFNGLANILTGQRYTIIMNYNCELCFFYEGFAYLRETKSGVWKKYMVEYINRFP